MLLGVGVAACGTRLHQHQGARAIARCPCPVHQLRLGAAVELIEQLHHFAGRVARQDGLDQQSGRRGQQIDAVAQSGMQAVCAKAFRRHRRTQQVTIVEQESTVALGVDGLAIIDAGKSRVGAQTLGDLLGKPGAGGSVGAFDANQNQARGQAVAELIHEQLLLGRGAARKKCRQVGSEVGAADNADTGQQKNQPQHDGGDAAAARVDHCCDAGFSMVINELSPSAWRISTLRTPSLAPSIRMRAMTLPTLASRGVSTSVQRSVSPFRARW